VHLSCTIYKDGVAIAFMDTETTTFNLNEYQPGGCYNIWCENDDMAIESKPFVKFTGHFTYRDGTTAVEHDAWNKHYWLLGSGPTQCVDLASSCQNLSLKIESWRNPSPEDKLDPVQLAKHVCASKTVTCGPPPVEVKEGTTPTVPRPKKCVLQRDHHTITFEPNYPAMEENAYIEVLVEKSQKIYQFHDMDTALSALNIEDPTMYDDIRFGEKLQ